MSAHGRNLLLALRRPRRLGAALALVVLVAAAGYLGRHYYLTSYHEAAARRALDRGDHAEATRHLDAWDFDSQHGEISNRRSRPRNHRYSRCGARGRSRRRMA